MKALEAKKLQDLKSDNNLKHKSQKSINVDQKEDKSKRLSIIR